MADSDAQLETAQQPATEQVTSAVSATKPEKNPKRIAAGKVTAQKTKMACEAQKKQPLKPLSLLQTARQNSRSPHRRWPLNPLPPRPQAKQRAQETFSPPLNG